MLTSLSNLQAQTRTWNLNANGGWNTPGNWTGSNVPDSSAETADFANIATSPLTITLDTNPTIGTLNFDSGQAYTITPSVAQGLTFGGGSQSITVGNSNGNGAHVIDVDVATGGGTLTITQGSTGDLTFANTISGAANITFNGTEKVIMQADNTQSGTWNITSGSVEVQHVDGLGDTGGATITNVSSGAALILNVGGTLDNEGLDIAGTGISSGGALVLSGGNSLTVSSGVVLSANSQINVDNAAGTLTLSGVVSDGASGYSITKEGAGTLVLSGSNTYEGATIVNAGTLSVSAVTALGSNPGSATPGHLTIDGGTLALSGTFIDANRGLTIGSSNGTMDLTGSVIYNGIMHGTGNLQLTGTGSFQLGGTSANTHSGTVTMNGSGTLQLSKTATVDALAGDLVITTGTVQLTAADQINNNSAVTNNGTFDLNGNNEAIDALGGSGNVTLGAGNLSVSSNGGSGSLSGIISGTGQLIHAGTGTLTLSGDNTYSGTTDINSGTIQIDHLDGLGDSGGATTTNVSSGATLAINVAGTLDNENLNITGTGSGSAGAIDHLGAITTTFSGSVTLTGNSSIDVSNAGGELIINSAIGDGGSSYSIDKTGSGTLTFGSGNTFDGGLTISAGTVKVTGSGELFNGSAGAGAITINSGASLDIDATTVNVIGGNANLVLNGGTLDILDSISSAVSLNFGTLDLQANSIIDFGTGSNGTNTVDIAFDDSSGVAWNSSAILSIHNWSDPDGDIGNGSLIDRLFFGSNASGLTDTQLKQIRFYSDAGSTPYLYFSDLLSTGEAHPAIPEASTWVISSLLCGLIGLAERRRRRRKAAC